MFKAMAQARKCLHKGFFQIFNENSSQWTPYAHATGPPPLERRNVAPLANGPPPLERRSTTRAIDTGEGWYDFVPEKRCPLKVSCPPVIFVYQLTRVGALGGGAYAAVFEDRSML